ncbi:PREDICTED: probable 28S rRNA (cytosine-C(5))-methyltransferase [Ceratosolen solmsi marchali]|uniref:Probable 28S rRNA (Cytosine-C(5))-methyltransferase n=1 Tax=Ceratosolen solmsi marchali TaxID=326594 RepID=A0AAJ6YFM2_9HYME|nr:PREDICTED: probable 28S rRNA (cytosine-C(5))-methyltransferase [Ceratosolen solmsi marchali]
MAYQNYHKNVPPNIIPQKRLIYEKYNHPKLIKPLSLEYIKAAKAISIVDKENVTIQDILDPSKSRFVSDVYNLASLAIQRSSEINFLLFKFEILTNNEFLDPWIARVLIAELLWGKQYLKSNAKEAETIKYYEENLREAYAEVTSVIYNPLDNNKLKLPIYVRINTLTISIEDTLRAFCKEGWNLLPRCNSYLDYLNTLTNLCKNDFVRDYHISELLAFPPGTILYNHPGYIKGKFLLQDKGSCLSSFLLNPKRNSFVLDLCAAPGIKSNHLANIMGNSGLIYSNDIHSARHDALCNLLQLTDVKNVKTLQHDFLNINISHYENIKYILVDPTCTYSGIFFEANKSSQKGRIQHFQYLLSMILRYTLQTFPNVKRVVYTTCSVYAEEGEIVIDDVLDEIGNSYYLLDIKEMLWNEWESVSSVEYACGDKCLRIVPEFDLCQGYFIAVFERNFDVQVPPFVKRFKKKQR